MKDSLLRRAMRPSYSGCKSRVLGMVRINYLWLLVVAVMVQLSIAQQSHAQLMSNCGQPDFDRFDDQGLFLWQNCGTGDWFFRVTNANRGTAPNTIPETRVDGMLRLASPIESAVEFNTEPGLSGVQDLLDLSNPNNVEFRFRVFSFSQDGFDFRIVPDTTACIIITNNPDDLPITVGRDNMQLRSPLNINTLTTAGCVTLTPIISLLLSDEES